MEPLLSKADFFVHKNGFVWAAMGRLAKRGEPIDYALLVDELERGGKLKTVGGGAYIGQLVNSCESFLRARDYALRVADMAERRRAIDVSSDLAQAAHKLDGEFGAEKARLARQLLTDSGPRRGVVPASEAMQEVYDQIEYNVKNPLRQGEVRYLSTGLVDLDRLTGGLCLGLHIVGAVTHTGKTAFCLTIAANVAVQGKKVFYASPEMTPAQLIERMVCAQARVDSDHLDSGRIPQDDYARFIEWQGAIAGWPLVISRADTMQEIRAQIYRECPVDLVIVDGIELINGGGSDKTHELRGEVARWGLNLATDPDVLAPVIIPAQIATKRVSERRDKRPLPGDIYASSEPEMATDVCLTLHRQDRWVVDKKETPLNNELEVTLWKHRLKKKAVPGMVKLRFGEYGDIADLSRQAEPLGF